MSFLISQLMTPLPIATADLTDRIVIVTGANVGLGLEAARHLARFNPKKLILACRNQEKGKKAVDYICESTNVASGIVECWELDLSSFVSVKAFAKRAEKELDRLDIVIENAGVAALQYRTTCDGWEETIQVNALSTFLLALLLLPLLRKTTALSYPHPRLVIVSSGVHKWTDIPLYRDQENMYQAMNDKDKFVGTERYPVSKLLDTLWTRELGSKLASSKYPEDKKISVSGVTPGLCKTELARESDSWAFHLILRVLARTAEQGSRTLIHAAIGDTGENYKGEYLSNCSIDEVSPFVKSEEGKATQTKLWNETMEILRKVAPEVDKLF